MGSLFCLISVNKSILFEVELGLKAPSDFYYGSFQDQLGGRIVRIGYK